MSYLENMTYQFQLGQQPRIAVRRAWHPRCWAGIASIMWEEQYWSIIKTNDIQ